MPQLVAILHSFVGAAVRPDIKLDGAAVGERDLVDHGLDLQCGDAQRGRVGERLPAPLAELHVDPAVPQAKAEVLVGGHGIVRRSAIGIATIASSLLIF